jgi:hypothetical protein
MSAFTNTVAVITGGNSGSGRRQPNRGRDGKVRYAVIGLGWISQSAMLPGFANVRRNSTMAGRRCGPARQRRAGSGGRCP